MYRWTPRQFANNPKCSSDVNGLNCYRINILLFLFKLQHIPLMLY